MDKRTGDFESTFEDEGLVSTVKRNFQTKPFVMASIIGFVGACGFGYYKFKTKGVTFTPSLFIMQLRVGAQSVAVGCLTLGMLYKLIDDHVINKKTKEQH